MILVSALVAGRKHQLRKACANVLQAPILGDGRYGLLRSPEQQWFQAQLQARNLALASAVQTHDLQTLNRSSRHAFTRASTHFY